MSGTSKRTGIGSEMKYEDFKEVCYEELVQAICVHIRVKTFTQLSGHRAVTDIK